MWVPEIRTVPLGQVTEEMVQSKQKETEDRIAKIKSAWDAFVDANIKSLIPVSGILTAVGVVLIVVGGPFFPVGCAAFFSGLGFSATTAWDGRKHCAAFEHVPALIREVRAIYSFNQTYNDITYEQAEQVAIWTFNRAWHTQQEHKWNLQDAIQSVKTYRHNIWWVGQKRKISFEQAAEAYPEIKRMAELFRYRNSLATEVQALEQAEKDYYEYRMRYT